MRAKQLLVTRLAPLALLFAPGITSAQTTGTLFGVVTDASTRKPVAGALVAASSPALQGEQTAVTDATGSYRISLLPPGPYRLTVQLEGYRPAERADIVVRLDKTLRADVALVPEAVQMEEQVVRTGIPPVVDVGSAATGTVVTKEFMADVPMGREFDSAALVPPGAQRDTFGVGFAGAGSPENSYLVDGLNVTDPAFGTLGSRLLTNFVEEVDVKTGSYMPEFGRSTAGVVNVVTKSGSNELHGSLFGNVTPGFLSPAGKDVGRYGEAIAVRDVPGRGSYHADFGAEVGGPILTDKLWFYVGFAPVIDFAYHERFLRALELDPATGAAAVSSTGQVLQRALPGTSRFYSNDQTTYQATGKLNYLLDEDNQFTLRLYTAPSSTKYDLSTNTSLFDASESVRLQQFDTSSTDLLGRYDGKALDKHLLFEAQGGLHRQTLKDVPRTIDGVNQRDTVQIIWGGQRDLGLFENVPADCDPIGSFLPCPVANYRTGGMGFVEDLTLNRWSGRAAVSALFTAAGHHVLKAGLDLERDTYDNTKLYTGGGAFQALSNGAGFLMARSYGTVPGLAGGPEVTPTFFSSVTSHSVTNTRGYFLQDSWSILDVLTLNGGIRWETQDMIDKSSPDSPHLQINDNIAPRVQAIWDFTGQGRGKLAASWGRFYEAIPLDMADRAFGSEVRVNALYSPCFSAGPKVPQSPAAACAVVSPPNNMGIVTDVFGNPVTYAQQGGVSPVAPDLKGQYVDQFGAQLEYELSPDLSVGLEYQGRRLGRVIEDMSSNNGATYFIANPSESKPWTYGPWVSQGLPQPNPRAAPSTDPVTGRTFLATFPPPERSYDGITLQVRKSFSRRWLAQASYTYSYFRGNYPGLFRSEDGQLDPNLTAEYDLPALFPNRRGPLPSDRPHQLKLFGSYVWDLGTRFNVITGAAFTVMSGTPINALAYSPIYGSGQAFILPRGSAGRTPALTNLDLRGGIEYVLRAPYSLRFTIDIFNVLNQQQAVNVDQNYTNDVVNSAQPIIGAQCKNHNGANAPDPIKGLQQDCPDVAYLKTVDGRPVTVNPNYGRPTLGPTPAHGFPAPAFQAPISVRFGISLTF